MALKVLKVITPPEFPFSYDKEKKLYKALADFSFIAYCNIDGEMGDLHFNIYKDCWYNGASNPLNWPIKNYYSEAKKDSCGLGHDLLYAWGGEVKGFDRKLTREESDDYIRGAMREANFTRFQAGCVDKAVELFASNHYGKEHDSEGMHEHSEIVWVPFKSLKY